MGFHPPYGVSGGLDFARAGALLPGMADLSTHSLEDLTIDEAARPKAPKVPAATDRHRRQGRHLAAIHRQYLMEMAQVGAVLARIEAGDTPPENLRRIVLSLDMAENFRVFGTLCGRECQVLKFHHDIESADMFPRIEAAGGGMFRQVVAKLMSEHEVVHELIVRLGRAAEALAEDPVEANFVQAAATFRKLEEVVRSHFGYEETELEEAIGYYLGTI
ncbi:hemerythrin domain-containing protein [Roseovarius sp. B08]|uniref:hemerythrin domain-containing protein n=1 Tax=Roseovarius sp. B08 TaxID=3449223 RepID=UPI003EDC5DB7